MKSTTDAVGEKVQQKLEGSVCGLVHHISGSCSDSCEVETNPSNHQIYTPPKSPPTFEGISDFKVLGGKYKKQITKCKGIVKLRRQQ